MLLSVKTISEASPKLPGLMASQCEAALSLNATKLIRTIFSEAQLCELFNYYYYYFQPFAALLIVFQVISAKYLEE